MPSCRQSLKTVFSTCPFDYALRPRAFEYYAPTELSEALTLLSETDDAKILAGGQSLITLMKLKLTSPASLIDINRIKELNYIREESGALLIGALTRHDQLAKSALIRQRCLLLAEAAGVIADQQVRNRGSIGGSLAHADPSADLSTACTALNVQIIAASREGRRSIPAGDFFLDFFTTALRRDELIVEVRIPLPSAGSGGAYWKLTKGHNDFALVAVAVQAALNRSGSCERVSVVLGGFSSKPTHAIETEKVLTQRRVDDRTLHEAASKATDGLTPTPDSRATADSKCKLARFLAERTLRVAFNRAGGVI